MPLDYSFDKSIIALDCGADHPVVCNCIKIERSDIPPLRAVFVQSTAAALSANSSVSNKSGSIWTLALRTLPSPTGLRFATFLPALAPADGEPPLCGPLGSGPLAGPALDGPLFGPADGPLLGPLGEPLFGPADGPLLEPPGGPRLGPDDGPLCGEEPGGPLLGPRACGPAAGPL